MIRQPPMSAKNAEIRVYARYGKVWKLYAAFMSISNGFDYWDNLRKCNPDNNGLPYWYLRRGNAPHPKDFYKSLK